MPYAIMACKVHCQDIAHRGAANTGTAAATASCRVQNSTCCDLRAELGEQ